MKKMFLILSSLFLSTSSLLTFNLSYKNNIILEMNSLSEKVTTSKFIKCRKVGSNDAVKENNHVQRTVKRCKKQDIKIEKDDEQPNEKMIISNEKWQVGFLDHFINQAIKEEFIEPVFNQKNDEKNNQPSLNQTNNVQESITHNAIQTFEPKNIIKKTIKLCIFYYITIGMVLIIDHLYNTHFKPKSNFWWIKNIINFSSQLKFM